MTSQGYEIFEDGVTRGLLVKGEWSAETPAVMKRERISHLRLSILAGWRGEDLTILNEVPWVKRLDLIGIKISNPAALYSLSNLNELTIDGVTPNLDFAKLPNLTSVTLGKWHSKKFSSVFFCDRLTRLSIGGYAGEDLAEFGGLVNLQSLSLGYSRLRSLRVHPELRNLTRLSIVHNAILQSLFGLARFPALLVLWLEKMSKLSDLAELARVKNLRTLIVGDCPQVSSIASVASLAQLETVGLMHRTNIRDGNLKLLSKLPKLKYASFDNRKHYDAKSEEFPKTLPAFY